MDYEIVNLKEKMVAGLKIRTSNNDLGMPEDISEAWRKFYQEGIYKSISQKVNDNTIGLYTNYENMLSGEYDVIVCCEVSKVENLPNEIEVKRIEEGKYAKFKVKGDVQKEIAKFWTEFWDMDIDRKFSYDFEEYIGNCETGSAEVNIYISIN